MPKFATFGIGSISINEKQQFTNFNKELGIDLNVGFGSVKAIFSVRRFLK